MVSPAVPFPDPGSARLFARFALTGLLAMVVIGAVAIVLLQRAATAQAVREAQELTHLAGRGIVQPLLTPGVLRGDPSAIARLDAAVRARILAATPIVRVKVWDASGRILYSDAGQLIGSRFPLQDDELAALRTGGTVADASDLSRPENRAERRFHRLLEVYFGIPAPGGRRLLFEVYERSSTVSANSRSKWAAFLPALLGALLVLYLVQVPLAYSLARRQRQRQLEREQLLQGAIEASDLERHRIAADLHDGAVQQLAGISFSLSAAARRLAHPPPVTPDTIEQVGAAAERTRQVIRELRTLLVDIYPPTLSRAGLAAALEDLVAPLTAAGVAVALELPERLQLPERAEALVYRIAQEAVRNARTHGQATTLTLAVTQDTDTVTLRARDDGRGFDPAQAAQHERAGHFGLRLMQDLIAHAGGELQIDSALGAGTLVQARVPLR